jgi:hypothetical protein
VPDQRRHHGRLNFTGVGVIGAVASVPKLALDAGKFKLFSATTSSTDELTIDD